LEGISKLTENNNNITDNGTMCHNGNNGGNKSNIYTNGKQNQHMIYK